MDGRPDQAKVPYGLTSHEVGILQQLCNLGTPTLIAEDTGAAVSTVRTHLDRCRAKAHVPVILLLVVEGLRDGWLH